MVQKRAAKRPVDPHAQQQPTSDLTLVVTQVRSGIGCQQNQRLTLRALGLRKIRQSVERCHNFFAQFGRIAWRWDRSARRFLGWVELAACIILIRSGLVRQSLQEGWVKARSSRGRRRRWPDQ